MAQRDMQGAVASHGNSCDAAALAAFFCAVMRVDERHEFLGEKILIRALALLRVDEERAAAIRSGDEEFADLHLLPEVLREVKAAGIDYGFGVLAQSVEKIDHG